MIPYMIVKKKVCNDQEMVYQKHSLAMSKPKLKTTKIKNRHLQRQNNVALSKWPLGYLNLTKTHSGENSTEIVQNMQYRESHQKYSLGTVSNIIILGGD